ncbi:MAG: Smr/MutS family protein [Desulfuromonadaceae bacterium]|nr:Smr/MutS family protein [Desulfuromonadaceae bacterium]MDD2854003.1 Smr/MutS family protein [Desulfuromonadaceae bacterium]
MAKKKKSPASIPRPKEFQVTPFSSLKGVVLPEPAIDVPVKTVVTKTEESPECGMNLFLQAFADVTPIGKSVKKQIKPEENQLHKIQKEVAMGAERAAVIEAAVFAEEISRLKMDTKFCDDLPDEDELQPLAGNRLRQVRRGVVSVDYQLDLHGLTREEALEALAPFLQSAQQKGQKAVLIITGKGIHSAEEPVLHQAVAAWLRDAGKATVLEFAPAPREMGGAGAYVAFLRQLTPAGKNINIDAAKPH